MYLPCELVGLNRRSKMAEFRDKASKSSIKWKILFLTMPKLLKKSYQQWLEYIYWLSSQEIETVYDFNQYIKSMYQVSEDREYFKEERNEENRYFQKKNELYGRVRYVEINEIIETDWREVIAEY